MPQYVEQLPAKAAPASSIDSATASKIFLIVARVSSVHITPAAKLWPARLRRTEEYKLDDINETARAQYQRRSSKQTDEKDKAKRGESLAAKTESELAKALETIAQLETHVGELEAARDTAAPTEPELNLTSAVRFLVSRLSGVELEPRSRLRGARGARPGFRVPCRAGIQVPAGEVKKEKNCLL